MKYIFKNLLVRLLAVFVILGIALINCGFKGPLYLPNKSAASAAKTASGNAKAASGSSSS